MKKIAFIVLSSLVVTSCSSYYASNGKQNYLESRNGPNLVVPEPLTTFNLSHFYDLPPQTQKNARVSIAPPNVSS